MPNLVVTDRSGEVRTIDGEMGRSVMEIVRDAGFGDIAAVCGGCCACATCHVFVDPAFLGTIPARSEDEDELLDSADHRRENSRLSCQIRFSDALDGLRIQIAPEE
jgi:2Fe-2S ferredoxin